ncbi:ferredoxin [Alternaria alternata]|uniref:Ferredoxin n=4 Tax=Alternaria sect. Alternaria TaxID=2499237 RepID=A0A177DUD3_ALTAL|nr:ferredoxin [Alternaria alternata]XP_051585395.1 mitochondrial matrix iron-sulfur protein [Alternaria postmessia]KAH6861417.1 2Fe-2S ferredoxin-type domain-containing protein [Alternaria alternata]KAI5372692.1 mitochondrial matrix iron-sulfur protein [Alternaria postmessia]OAG22582.1 ferredoxin [Alternaria alternata]
MAVRRACLSALEGRIAGARGASSSPQRFASNWTASACQKSLHTPMMASSLLSQSSVIKATSPSWLRNRRQFSSSPTSRHGHLDPPRPGEERKVTFIDKDGHATTFEVADGDNLLDIAQANDIEMEGACGGSCACSTCHVIVADEAYYDKMEEPDDDENDMLDLAFGLTETSRLGCQVKMSKELDGLVVRLPSMTRNLQASDFDSK